MALIAGQINPANYPQPDYSGVVRSAQMQAQGLANIGASIGGAIKDFGEAKKERKKLDAEIKASVTGIESAIKMGESLGIDVKSSLSPYLDKINDPTVTPIEAAALAQQASSAIGNILNFGMKANELGVQENKYIGEVAAKQLEYNTKLNQRVPESISFGGRDIGVEKDGFGNIYDPDTGREITNLNKYAAGAEDYGPPVNETPKVSVDGSPGVLPPLITPELGDNVNYDPNTVQNAIEYANSLSAGRNDVSNVSPIVVTEAPVTPTPVSPAAPVDKGLTPRGTLRTTGGRERGMTEAERVAADLPPGDYTALFKDGVPTNIKQLEPDSIEKLKQNRMLKADERIEKVIESTDKGAERLVNMNEALSLLNSGEVKSGAFASYKLAASRIFGMDVANEEQFNSLVGNLAMEAIDLTKGAISDREMTFFREELAPNLNKSVEGNKKILEFKIKAAERGLRINQVARDMLANDALPSEIEKEIKKIQNEDSLMTIKSKDNKSMPSSGLNSIYDKHLSPPTE